MNHPCPIPICENCQNGVCLAPNKCICEIGWDGPSCDICIPLPGCVHGDCKDKALTCDCEPNWQGAYCDARKF